MAKGIVDLTPFPTSDTDLAAFLYAQGATVLNTTRDEDGVVTFLFELTEKQANSIPEYRSGKTMTFSPLAYAEAQKKCRRMIRNAR